MLVAAEAKPQLWAFDLGSVDPYWWDFWKDCIVCIPAWETRQADNKVAPQMLGRAFRGGAACGQTGSNAQWGTSLLGNALRLNTAGGNTWTIPAISSVDVVPTTRVTYLIVRERETTAAISSGWGVTSATASNRAGGHMPFSDGTIYWDFGGNAGANRLTWTGYSAVANVTETWAFVAGKCGMAIYFNGRSRNTSATAVTRTAGNNTISVIADGNGVAGGYLAKTSFFAVLDAEWTPGQVSAWHADPFAPLRMMEFPTVAAAPTVFRRTLSSLGTRTGSRQAA